MVAGAGVSTLGFAIVRKPERGEFAGREVSGLGGKAAHLHGLSRGGVSSAWLGILVDVAGMEDGMDPSLSKLLEGGVCMYIRK